MAQSPYMTTFNIPPLKSTSIKRTIPNVNKTNLLFSSINNFKHSAVANIDEIRTSDVNYEILENLVLTVYIFK